MLSALASTVNPKRIIGIVEELVRSTIEWRSRVCPRPLTQRHELQALPRVDRRVWNDRTSSQVILTASALTADLLQT